MLRRIARLLYQWRHLNLINKKLPNKGASVGFILVQQVENHFQTIRSEIARWRGLLEVHYQIYISSSGS